MESGLHAAITVCNYSSSTTIIIIYLLARLLLSLLLFLEFVVVGHTFRARVLFWVAV